MNFRQLKKFLSSFKAVILCGLPGAGKSTNAKIIAKEKGMEYLSTDEIRIKELFPQTSRFNRGNVSQKKHTEVVRRKVYDELAIRAIENLKNGRKVVLDGTFLDQLREMAIKRLLKLKELDKVAVIVVEANKDTIKMRLKAEDLDKWENQAYAYFSKALKEGKASYPVSSKRVKVFKIRND